MVMNVIPDRPVVIALLLGKRQGLAHQAANSLPQRIVQALNPTGLATLPPTGAMAFGRQHSRICLPKIGVAHSTLAIHGRERLPQQSRSGSSALAQGHTDNLATVPIERQPQPALVSLAANEGPQFVTLDP